MTALPSNRIEFTKFSTLAMTVGVVATVFDAVASYISIVSSQIAEEGNAILNILFTLITSWGYPTEIAFGVTMTVRAAFGVALLIVLFFIAKRGKTERERNTAAFGLAVVGAILTGIAIYHVVGMLIFG